MSQWIYELSNFSIAALVISFGLMITTVCPILLRRYAGWDPNEHWIKGTEEGFKLFTSLSLMILAFCLVRVQGDHRNIEDLVGREGVIATKIYRAMGNYDGPEGAVLQSQLKSYAQTIVNKEWVLLAKGEQAPEASALLASMSKSVRALDADTPAKQLVRVELVGSLTQLSDVRDARLAASHAKLPNYYYQALVCALLALAFFGWFQTPLYKMAAYVGSVTVGLGMMLTLLIVTSGHFAGESAVHPVAIERALAAMASP